VKGGLLMSNQYHESVESLDENAKEYVRALNSLKEEIEAVDWYQQRIDASIGDEELQGILAHNRDEEIEHAAMLIEWLRRNMPAWDEELKTYLFTEGPIVGIEEGDTNDEETDGEEVEKGLNIGDLK